MTIFILAKTNSDNKRLSISKVSEYPFMLNENMIKNKKKLSHIYFYNISLNLPRPIFFKIYCLPFSRTPNIRKIKVKAGLKNNYFSYFMSFCINRIAVFNNLLGLIRGQTTGQKNVHAISLFSNIFWIICF